MAHKPGICYFTFTEPLIIRVHRYYFELSAKRPCCDRYRRRFKEGLYSPCLDSPAHCKNATARPCDTAENPWKYNYSPAATNQRKAATVSKKRLMIVVLDFFVANEKWLNRQLPNELACFRICNIFVNRTRYNTCNIQFRTCLSIFQTQSLESSIMSVLKFYFWVIKQADQNQSSTRIWTIYAASN